MQIMLRCCCIALSHECVRLYAALFQRKLSRLSSLSIQPCVPVCVGVKYERRLWLCIDTVKIYMLRAQRFHVEEKEGGKKHNKRPTNTVKAIYRIECGLFFSGRRASSSSRIARGEEEEKRGEEEKESSQSRRDDVMRKVKILYNFCFGSTKIKMYVYMLYVSPFHRLFQRNYIR